MFDYLQKVIQNIQDSFGTDGVPRMNPNQTLYNMALSFIGVDASPNDLAPDEVGCAETVDTIYHQAFGRFIGGGKSPTLSTATLHSILRNSPIFEAVDIPMYGDIVISPTGSPGTVGSGHTGIVGKFQIMSNDSRSGTWEANYTVEGWKRLFGKRGFPTYFYRRI